MAQTTTSQQVAEYENTSTPLATTAQLRANPRFSRVGTTSQYAIYEALTPPIAEEFHDAVDAETVIVESRVFVEYRADCETAANGGQN